MQAVYDLAVGPLAWLAGAVFIVGSIYRLASMYRLTKKKDPLVLEYMSFKFGLRSILHWSIPFMPVNSRRHPVMTVVTFLFHLCLILLPIFLFAHTLLWEYFHGLSLPGLPEHLADLMTVFIIAACVFFAVRRAVRPEVRFRDLGPGLADLSRGGSSVFDRVPGLPSDRPLQIHDHPSYFDR